MSKWSIQAGWEDVPHIDAAAVAEMASSYMPHEREARIRGVPSLGAGAIYPVPESEFVIAPIEFPIWYKHFYCMDVGWNRTAVLWGAVDPETDVLYWYSEHYQGSVEPPIHAAGIKSRGDWIPGVIDPAARGRSQIDGNRLLDQYTGLGLRLITANNAVEAGIYQVWTRKSTGRLKVFNTLQNYLAEHRIYRRDMDGKRVKEMDHLMDAERYGVMSGVAIAQQRPAELWGPTIGSTKGRHQSEYSPLASMWNPTGGSATSQPQPRNWMPFKT